jgi:O-antigen/teichoic acid export membrane protein
VSLRRNIIANYLGQGWIVLAGLAFVPLYIERLGMEAYGLIGFYIVMQAWLTLLDLGMTPTLNREMARFTAGGHSPRSIGDLVRSLEVICIAIALLIGAGFWAASGWLAADWLQAEKLPVLEVARAISVMGWVLALRFVEGLYRGAILGLQRQVWLNGMSALFATVRWGGAAIMLVWVSATIEAFFLWQALVSVGTVAVFAVAVHRALPRHEVSSRFSNEALTGISRFAGGMMLTTVLVLMLTQVDKIMLSRLLSLDSFGRYTFAAAVAGALLQLVGPISQALYPRFTELVEHGDDSVLVYTYHRAAQLVSVLIIPAMLLMAMFGENLLALWTGDAALAHDVAPLLTPLAIGYMLNGLMHVPYMLQLAYGWSGFAARVNLVAVIFLVPAILWVVPRYGAIGAAWVWVALNSGYVFISMHFMHARLLPGEKWRWYLKDTVHPMLAAAGIALLCNWAYRSLGTLSMPIEVMLLSLFGALITLAAVLVVPTYRVKLRRHMSLVFS